MSYQALYRVWRPQSFNEVIGQGHVTKTLQNAIAADKISHAYLFSGPRGTGKTSLAKIFAKAVNCEDKSNPEPCNQCAACKGITNGTITDVIEIDAASNNGVDEIRDLRDKSKYAPSAVQYKVYIIDEVHMLSTGAFNALLKTLEEPPKHVIFILATTEDHKIPLTILSRCQRYNIKRIGHEDIMGRMKVILSNEGTSYDSQALEIIARAAEGGMRDALSLLDQAISYSSDDTLTVNDALTVTGQVSQLNINEMVYAVYKKNTRQAITLFHDVISLGKDPIRLVEDLIMYYRDLVLYQTSPSMPVERLLVDKNFEEIAYQTSSEQTYRFIEELTACKNTMQFSSNKNIAIEVLLIKLCQHQQGHTDLFEQLQNQLQQLQAELEELKKGQPTAPTTVQSAKTDALPDYVVPMQEVDSILSKGNKQLLQEAKQVWPQVLKQLSVSPSNRAYLLNSEPVVASPHGVLIQLPTKAECVQLFADFQAKGAIEAFLQRNIVLAPEAQWNKIKNDYIANIKKARAAAQAQ